MAAAASPAPGRRASPGPDELAGRQAMSVGFRRLSLAVDANDVT
jgi:hypothetical protein